MITGLSVAIIPYSTFVRGKLSIKNKYVSKHLGFQNTLRGGNKIYFNIQGNNKAI